MKQMIIAVAALAMILNACSGEEESVSNSQTSIEHQEEENSEEVTEIDNSERHQFEVGESRAESRKSYEEAREVLAEELERMTSESPLITTKIDTVEVDVTGAELFEFVNDTHLQIDFAIENTVNEPKQLPLERAIVVTNTGVQAEGERHLSDAPEWDMKGAVKSEGFVVFDLGKEPIEDIESVTLIIPGVDFQTDLEERIEINFNE